MTNAVHWANVIGRPSWFWATVQTVTPTLTVRMDTSNVNIPVVDQTVGVLAVGDRVMVQMIGVIPTIVGRRGGSQDQRLQDLLNMPAPWSVNYPSGGDILAAASSWTRVTSLARVDVDVAIPSWVPSGGGMLCDVTLKVDILNQGTANNRTRIALSMARDQSSFADPPPVAPFTSAYNVISAGPTATYETRSKSWKHVISGRTSFAVYYDSNATCRISYSHLEITPLRYVGP